MAEACVTLSSTRVQRSTLAQSPLNAGCWVLAVPRPQLIKKVSTRRKTAPLIQLEQQQGSNASSSVTCLGAVGTNTPWCCAAADSRPVPCRAGDLRRSSQPRRKLKLRTCYQSAAGWELARPAKLMHLAFFPPPRIDFQSCEQRHHLCPLVPHAATPPLPALAAGLAWLRHRSGTHGNAARLGAAHHGWGAAEAFKSVVTNSAILCRELQHGRQPFSQPSEVKC